VRIDSPRQPEAAVSDRAARVRIVRYAHGAIDLGNRWRSDPTGGAIVGIITSPIAAIVASYFGISVARAAVEDAGAAQAAAGLAQLNKEQAIDSMAGEVKDAATCTPLLRRPGGRPGSAGGRARTQSDLGGRWTAAVVFASVGRPWRVRWGRFDTRATE
jgi:hypothetical protein